MEEEGNKMKLRKIFEIFGKFWRLLIVVYWVLLLLNSFKVIVGYWIDGALSMATLLIVVWIIWFIVTGIRKFIRKRRK